MSVGTSTEKRYTTKIQIFLEAATLQYSLYADYNCSLQIKMTYSTKAVF